MGQVSKSRFANSAKNMAFSLLAQMVTIVLNIIGRRVFVQVLNAQYLGVSTAFSSILTVLGLAELGVGSAIIYSLYKPIADNDREKIKSLMSLYRTVYCGVGGTILVAGAAMTPFLDVFVEEMPQIPGIQWIYLMLVVQSGSTYFFSYKTSFLNATQQSYINRKYEMAASVAQISAQIAILLLWGNYYLYLAIGIVCPFLKNIFATRQVDRMYPFLKEKAQKLSREETVKIRKNVLALFLYKVCNTIVVTIDTLLISRMFGVIQVAVYSNYHMISSYSDKLFIQGLGAITPSIGNLMTTDDVEKKRQFFSALQMIYYWLSSYLAVGMVVLFNPLIELWLGEEYLFSQSVVIVLVISNTLTNFQRPCSLMRDANGLFWHGKLRPLVMTIINIVASIWLGVVMGVIGVVIGTCISKLLTFVWFDPYVVYKHTLHKGLKQYFIKYALYWGLLVVLTVACQTLYDWIGLSGIPGLIVGFVSVSVVVNGVFLLIHYKTKEFDYLKNMISNLLRKRRDGR